MTGEVAVGIITHNSARCLERCLQSLHVQSSEPAPILVWDNGSSDASAMAQGFGGHVVSAKPSPTRTSCSGAGFRRRWSWQPLSGGPRRVPRRPCPLPPIQPAFAEESVSMAPAVELRGVSKAFVLRHNSARNVNVRLLGPPREDAQAGR